MITKELVQKTLDQLEENEQEEVLEFINYLLWRQGKFVQLKTYDFSDLAGKLTWQGDAVATQRDLRDEWE